jgi:transcriptional regulator NrdR family protein
MQQVIKRNGKLEDFNPVKLESSVKATCLAVHMSSKDANKVSKKITEHVSEWLKSKNEVTSTDIRQVVAKNLSKTDPHAGYLYKHHRIMG